MTATPHGDLRAGARPDQNLQVGDRRPDQNRRTGDPAPGQDPHTGVRPDQNRRTGDQVPDRNRRTGDPVPDQSRLIGGPNPDRLRGMAGWAILCLYCFLMKCTEEDVIPDGADRLYKKQLPLKREASFYIA